MCVRPWGTSEDILAFPKTSVGCDFFGGGFNMWMPTGMSTMWCSLCALPLFLLLLASHSSQGAASLTCSGPYVTYNMNPYHFVQNSLAKPVLRTGANNCARISQRFAVPCELRGKFFCLIKDISGGNKIFIHLTATALYALTASLRMLKDSRIS